MSKTSKSSQSKKRATGCCRFKMRRGITMDSAAGDSVMPRRMVNKDKIRKSPGSRRGLNYVAADNGRLPNVGEMDVDFTTLDGHDESWVFQIADVNKPLGCVADRVDRSCRVVFDQDDETGQDLSYILKKKTGQVIKMRRTGKVWVLDAIVSSDLLATELFTRHG